MSDAASRPEATGPDVGQKTATAALVKAAGMTLEDLPRVPVDWTLLSVGTDGRSLLVTCWPTISLGGDMLLSVRETETEIWISVELRDVTGVTGLASTAASVRWSAWASLELPVGGRPIIGPPGSPTWDRAGYAVIATLQGCIYPAPTVVGLSPADGVRLLSAQGFQVGGEPRGREIVSQDPPGDAAVDQGSTITIVGGAGASDASESRG